MSEVRTALGDVQVLVRAAGGQQVKVTVPKAMAFPANIAEAVAVAVAFMPGPPGPHT